MNLGTFFGKNPKLTVWFLHWMALKKGLKLFPILTLPILIKKLFSFSNSETHNSLIVRI